VKAEELVKAGKLDEALTALQDEVRNNPAKPALRVFLFQLLCVLGRWDRALTQLNVAAEMDPKTLLMAQACRSALQCEALRAKVFAGERTPLVMGEPQEWIGKLFESLRLLATGHPSQAADLRAQAFEDAPAVSGFADAKPFDWLADADERLGPVFECIIEGRYYWVPMNNVAAIDIEAPADLRDVVWSPVTFRWTNGGDSIGFMPVRYAGTESSSDDAARLARKTDFVDAGAETYIGVGQRIWATPDGDHAMLQTRRICFGPEWVPAPHANEQTAPGQDDKAQDDKAQDA
jgi:type VI secretion system protein ImpE